LKDLVEAAKAKPKQIAYGSAGYGSVPHFATEIFAMTAKIELIHVPYKGAGPAYADALAGNIPLVIGSLAGAMPLIDSGRLRALAVNSPKRWPGLPDIPTMAELGYPKATHGLWLGLLAPAGTPASIVEVLNHATNEVLAEPAVRQRLLAIGTESIGGLPSVFGTRLKEDSRAVDDVVRETGLKVE
jgi:tripartite-type tricarboxylate transporter receptor subunit TctC